MSKQRSYLQIQTNRTDSDDSTISGALISWTVPMVKAPALTASWEVNDDTNYSEMSSHFGFSTYTKNCASMRRLNLLDSNVIHDHWSNPLEVRYHYTSIPVSTLRLSLVARVICPSQVASLFSLTSNLTQNTDPGLDYSSVAKDNASGFVLLPPINPDRISWHT